MIVGVLVDSWAMPDGSTLTRYCENVDTLRTGPYEWRLDGDAVPEVDGQWLWLGRLAAWNDGWRP